MPEQNRWSEDRNSGGGSRDDDRSSRESYNRTRYGGDYDRDQFSAYGVDRSGLGGESRRGGDGGRISHGDNRSVSYQSDQYGIPSDYNFGRPQTRTPRQDAPFEGRFSAEGFGSPRYDDSIYDGQGYAYAQPRYRQTSGVARQSSDFDGYRDRDGGYHPYQSSAGARPREERSWWDRTQDEVSSWFGDDGAARRRQQDERHADAHHGKGPKGYVRSDERIREDVNDRLTDHPGLDASDIDVSVSASEVTLTGTVRQRQDKRYAEDAAERVSGVKHVQNNLRVKNPDQDAKFSGYSASGATASQTGVPHPKAN